MNINYTSQDDCFISAIAPFFNKQTTISACLSSMEPFVDEIILVDNHSLDDTRDKAETQLSKLDIEWEIIDLPQTDPLYCRMKAIEQSHGAWIIDFDGDEIYNSEQWLEVREWLRQWWNPKETNIILPYRLIMLQGDYWHYGIDISKGGEEVHYPVNVPHQKLFTYSDKIVLPDIKKNCKRDHPLLDGYYRYRWLADRKDLACNLRGWESYKSFYLNRQLILAKSEDRAMDKHWSELRGGFSINEQKARDWILKFLNKYTALRVKLNFLMEYPPKLFREVRELKEKCDRELVYDLTETVVGRWPDLPPSGLERWDMSYGELANSQEFIIARRMAKRCKEEVNASFN